MNVRVLRNEKNWSQEQLAHFSGLSIRTIQRIENNEKVGLESLKSLAAVFEIDLRQIKQDTNMQISSESSVIEEKDGQQASSTLSRQEEAKQYVAEVKSFYTLLVIYISTFMLWPFFALVDEANNNDMWWFTLYMGIFYLVIIANHANHVFQPFGEKWQKQQQQKYLDKNK